MKLTLGNDSKERKETPIRSGCISYFPAAIAGVARHSVRGNNKHNPGEPLHHARGKSMDHADCIDRHLTDLEDMVAAFDRGPEVVDTDLILEEADALCWRALALSQQLYERFGGAPLAPRAHIEQEVNPGRGSFTVCAVEGFVAPVVGCDCKPCTLERESATHGV